MDQTFEFRIFVSGWSIICARNLFLWTCKRPLCNSSAGLTVPIPACFTYRTELLAWPFDVTLLCEG